MASEPVECQVVVLRVSIHCEGCKKKVKKVLLHVDGVFRCDIDARSNRVAVTTSTKIDAGILIARLRKSGKLAEPWPEQPKQQQEPPPPAESQSQETKNQTDDASKPNEAAENAAPAAAAAAEPSNAQPPAPEPEKTTNETPPPAQESKEPNEPKAETGPQQPPNEANGTQQQQQQQQHDHHDKPMDARVTMEFDDARSRSIYGYGGHQQYMPATRQPPVHVMSYNVARPMASSSYYAAAPTPAAMPMPMPMARPGPSQGGYIDEYAPPNYYSRPAPSSYEPYYYSDPQPSPYQHQRSAADDYYYGAPPPPPQRSAFSPPREAYGDMFNDENANSCSVM
ncbi:hypothetical protein ZWY2020_027261 [Hordeum vulgare]|uniref:Predicted protein n=1 Tax=Hordeum vulgare subsp. vulgare TaxID=112509 RepID=F2DAD5_HORVV|nr:hypothetical protein ZWY2020_027261 [Hordeum vulgare]BAJ92056.1 predicted protein [Hordeum vulgare subsp. vulgare]